MRWTIPVLVTLAPVAAACAAPRPSSRTAEPSRSEAPVAAAVSPEAAFQARYANREPIAVLRGRASYYSDRLAGNRTASGDVYDPRALTAASRDLPFGTIVRVVRVDTGASIVVRINDRGPFGDRRRILDLSRTAAEALDMMRAGVIDVRAEILERPARR